MGTALALGSLGLPLSLLAQGFASSVAVVGDEVLVGETGEGGSGGGVVYIYTRSGDAWVETGRLVHPEPSENDGFGINLAASGDRLLVTAVNRRSPEGAGVHAYSKTSGGWNHDGLVVAEGLAEGMIFGTAIGMSGDVAAIGAAARSGGGAVLIFRNVNGGWVQESILDYPGSDEGSGFGSVLAIDGGTLVVGAPLADSLSGAAYVYGDGPDGWAMTGELTIADGPNSFFGMSAAVMGNRVLVGVGGLFGQPGNVVAFIRQDGEWS